MPRDEPTEDIVRREIKRARQILREDRVIKAHGELMGRLTPPADPGNPPGTPPAPEPRDPVDPPKKPGVWWGDQE
jgi:hypothetical protein